MQFQSNPYLAWQLLSGFLTLAIGGYIQSRPVKKRESNVFSLLMLSGSVWAFANAIQLVAPDLAWQRAWSTISYLGIMLVPTAWFLLCVKLTGIARERVERVERRLWAVPAFFYLALLTNGYHKLFLVSSEIVTAGGFATLESQFGVLFGLHTLYSYLLLLAGLLVLAASLAADFKRYGAQAYGLMIGVAAPLIGNVYFVFGSPPPGFPDPTPLMFTVTGVAFGWAIFGGRLLEVVPLAHDAIVQRLSSGILILDLEKNIKEINPAAKEMIGLPDKAYDTTPLPGLAQEHPALVQPILAALDAAPGIQELQVTDPERERSFAVQVSRIADSRGAATGWLIHLSDISAEVQAEESLATTRETLSEVLDTLQDSYFEADLQGIVTYANRAFGAHLGFSKEEVAGKHFRHFTGRGSIRDIYRQFSHVIETNRPMGPFPYTYRTRDGRAAIGEMTVSPIREGDRVVGTRGLIRDVTDRIRAEREILEQKELLDSLLQQSPLAMVINDMDKKVKVVNPAFEKLFGFTREEAVGKRLDELLASPGSAGGLAELSTGFLSPQPSRAVKRQRKDGSLVDVEVFAAPFYVGGEKFGHLAFYNDIAERLKAEAERLRTQITYQAVLDSLQDSYFEADREGVFTYVNQAFVNGVGYASKADLIGKHFRHIASRKSLRLVYEKFKKVFETHQAIEPFEFIYRTVGGVEFTSELVVSPILEDGRAVGTRGIVRDISVRVKAEEMLRQAKEAAEYRAGELAAINRVAATVSRSLDFRSVLQSVCTELTGIFPIRNAGIGLLTPDKQGLEIVAFHSVEPAETSALGMVLPLEGHAAAQEVIRSHKTLVLQNAQIDARTSSLADLYRKRGTKAIMVVPLLARGEAIGTIGMPARDPDHVFSPNEAELAETIASQIAAAIQNARLHTRTELALGAAEQDLEIGRQIQSGFFPETLPHIPGWEVAAHFDAARQVAGDFYDVFRFRNSSLTALVIADVCDKGVGAALFMVLFRSLLRAFSQAPIEAGRAPERLRDIVLSTNNFVAEVHGRSNMFATLFFGILDPDRGELHYVNAGHEPPLVFDSDGAILHRLDPTGPAVGLFPDLPFQVESVQFQPGDALLGFTDGATEAKNTAGEPFSETRLLECLAAPRTSMFSLLFEVDAQLRQHIGEQPHFDDITLLALRRRPAAQAERHAISRGARLACLGELLAFTEQAARHSGLRRDEILAFRLACEEICTNIIQHGYPSQPPGVISLSFGVEDSRASLTIRDDGQHFSPEQAKLLDLEADWNQREIGGLGLFLVKDLMDQVTYTKTGASQNQFVLQKRLDRPAPV